MIIMLIARELRASLNNIPLQSSHGSAKLLVDSTNRTRTGAGLGGEAFLLGRVLNSYIRGKTSTNTSLALERN